MTTTTTQAKALSASTNSVAKAPTKKTRKTPEKRGFTSVGKFFAKVRIDLDLTSEQWAKKVGVSASYVNNVERGDKEFDLYFVRKVESLLLPEHKLEFANIVASVLGVLVIPADATDDQIKAGFYGLHSAQLKQEVVFKNEEAPAQTQGLSHY